LRVFRLYLEGRVLGCRVEGSGLRVQGFACRFEGMIDVV
jgi:hypothetical protein